MCKKSLGRKREENIFRDTYKCICVCLCTHSLGVIGKNLK